MELTDRINSLEDEINLLKAEVKAVLVDLREDLLKRQSPFAPAAVAVLPMPAADRSAEEPAPPLHRVRVAPDPEPLPALFGGLPPHDETALATDGAPSPWGDSGMHLFESAEDFAAHPFADEGEGTMDRRNWGALDIASLCKWADAATRRIGRKRLEDALEVYELLLGPFPAGTKEAITRMADLCTAHPEPEQVSMNDIVAVLTQLDSLIREHARSDLAMLALLSDAA